jgi:hypothetical protein
MVAKQRETRHRSLQAVRPLRVDIVAKVFLGCRKKILRAIDAFYARRRILRAFIDFCYATWD